MYRILKMVFLILSVFFCSDFVSANQKFLIVANGPFDLRVVKDCLKDRTVVALDGAAVKLYKHQINVNYVLGDFDSLTEACKKAGVNPYNATEVIAYFKNQKKPDDSVLVFEHYTPKTQKPARPIVFVRTYSQNYTDLDKGIQFCLNQAKAGETVDIQLVCALGGNRTDHSLGNFAILRRYNKKQYPNLSLTIVTSEENIKFLQDETMTFASFIGEKCGIFGFPEAKVDCQELRWPLTDMHLKVGYSDSSCNEVKSSPVTISVKGEALIIMPRTARNRA